MKIRRGFVTNSSSTNFGTMLVTSLSGIGLASLLSLLDGPKESEEMLVRLVIEAPEEKILIPGNTYRISARIMVLMESVGEFKVDNQATEEIEFRCSSENNSCQFLDPLTEPDAAGANAKLQGIFVIADEEKLNSINSGGLVSVTVSGSYQGKGMSRKLEFRVPVFTVKPAQGSFLVEMGTKQEFDLSVNTGNAIFVYDLEGSGMLKSEAKSIGDQNLAEHITLMECIDDASGFFKPSIYKIVKDFEIKQKWILVS